MTKKTRICIDGINCDWTHQSSFKHTQKYIKDLDIKDSDELILEKECNLWEGRYISHHLMSAVIFFIYFAFAGFIITLLHETFQASCYLFFGYDYGGMEITIDSGVTFVKIPIDAPFWWYLLVFIGPSIFVEGLILFIFVFNIKYEVKPVFLDGVRNLTMHMEMIKKAFGWFCAVKLTGMILFFPITSLIYGLLGENRSSDLIMAWNSTQYLIDAPEILWVQISVVLSASLLLTMSGLYLYSVNRASLVT